MKTKNHTNKLKALRETRGMSQVELAARSDVGLSLINKVERWHFRVRRETAEKIANVLGVSSDRVFPYLRQDGGR
jgi:transcriptional regulator with XRE-family HTH domain